MLNDTCHYSAEELLDYLEETLSEEQSREVESHLLACAGCLSLARRVTEFHDTLGMLKTHPDAPSE